MTAKPKNPKSSRAKAPRGGRSSASSARKKASVAEAAVETAAPVVASAPEADLPGEAFTPPEINFSARMPATPDQRPRPSRRRAVFIDVENTSRPGKITEAFEALRIDHANATTDIVASGNWRVIGNETARLLAGRGAQLVHSAPKTGVRDWSDLRIAVGAGVWLASARPGDRLDVVSDDKAFDAVGDVAATLGVEFHRHMFKRGTTELVTEASATTAPRSERERSSRGGSGRRRGGRGRSGGGPRGGRSIVASSSVSEVAAPSSELAPSSEIAPAAAAVTVQEVTEGAAPVDDLLRVVREQLAESPQGITLNAVANRLKQLGFQRPPNSPRLVTRIKAFKELSVTPRGLIRMAGAPGGDADSATDAPVSGSAPSPAGSGRRRRRGGRGRRGGAPVSATPPPSGDAG